VILVAFALPFEEGGFAARCRRKGVSFFTANATGERFARLLSMRLEEMRPTALILAGFAGGLEDRWGIGDIAIGRNTTQSIYDYVNKRKSWLPVVKVATVPAALTTFRDKSGCASAFNASICTMEDAPAATICQQLGIPYLALRSISDRLRDELPLPVELLAPPDGYPPNAIRILAHIALRPHRWRAFLGMVRNAHHARRTLHQALEEVLIDLADFPDVNKSPDSASH
jgi:nucleoside phosphorylase